MNTYLAITIGPIYKTMQQARKTREAWISSYFFSLLMKHIYTVAKSKGSVILPTEKSKDNFFGAGIYPDRLIMTLTDENIDVQTQIIDIAIKEFATNIKIEYNTINSYLNIHFIKISKEEIKSLVILNDKKEEITSDIHKLNYLLDVKELNLSYQNSDSSFFTELFKHATRKELYKTEFNSKKYKFDSIFDISAQHSNALKEAKATITDNDNIEVELLKNENFLNKLKKHEKYIAIIQADGDNFGKVVASFNDDGEKLNNFSKDLVAFSEKASAMIDSFGGTIIYIGGDDILAFCPVKDNSNKTIFDLIDELNKEFHKVFDKPHYIENKVSLSYGLSITYYKYPLNEAMKLAYQLLMYKAKKQPHKNCIAFQLLQHSGQTQETILEFGDNNNFNSFLIMIDNFSEKDKLLQSLTHTLIEDKILLQECLKNKDRLNGYFLNHYNTNEKTKDVKDFIDAVKKNLFSTYKKLVEQNEKNPEKIKETKNIEFETLSQLNTLCRTINFLNSENE